MHEEGKEEEERDRGQGRGSIASGPLEEPGVPPCCLLQPGRAAMRLALLCRRLSHHVDELQEPMPNRLHLGQLLADVPGDKEG